MIKGLVSVVIPVYNDFRFLAETIGSVQQQTYPDWEILLIDDGSKDAGALEAFARSYLSERFRFIRNPRNIGLAGSRNVGIREAKGEFICFLDADDILCERKFEIQAAELNADPALQMTFSDEYVIRDGVRIDAPQQFPGGLPPDFSILDTFVRSSFIAVFTVMLRTAVFESTGPFNSTLRWNEDDDLWFRIMLKGGVLYSPYVSGYRRLHDQNMSLNRLKMNFFQLKTFVIWLKTCKSQGRKDLKKVIRDRALPLAKNYLKTTLRRGKIDWKAFMYSLQIFLS